MSTGTPQQPGPRPDLQQGQVHRGALPDKVVLVIIDGVGDVTIPAFGDRTPLQVAHTPNLDCIAGALGGFGQHTVWQSLASLSSNSSRTASHIAPGRGLVCICYSRACGKGSNGGPRLQAGGSAKQGGPNMCVISHTLRETVWTL